MLLNTKTCIIYINTNREVFVIKKALLIYNPISGNGLFKDDLDKVVASLQNGSDFCMVSTLRISKGIQLDSEFMIEQYKQYDTIIIAGGDGTVGWVANILIDNNIDIPIGVIPAGTANDFASYLKMPKDPVKAALAIAKGTPFKSDLGRVGNKHFINVVALGSFANTSDETSSAIKPKLGVYAYYLTAIEKLHTYEPVKVKISYNDTTIEESAFLVLILNSSNVGGFANLSPNSSITDGLLDLIIFKTDGKIIKSAKTFVDVLRGQHLNNSNVLYVQADKFVIEPIHDEKIYLDIDGDKGTILPATINVAPKAITLIKPFLQNNTEDNNGL